VRDWHARRFRAIHIAYPGGRIAAVPLGFSILERAATRTFPTHPSAEVAAAVSTCRVRIVKNIESLPKPSAIEDERCVTSMLHRTFVSRVKPDLRLTYPWNRLSRLPMQKPGT